MTNNDIIKLCKELGIFNVAKFSGGTRQGKESVFDFADVEILNELRILVNAAIKKQKRKDLIEKLKKEDI